MYTYFIKKQKKKRKTKRNKNEKKITVNTSDYDGLVASISNIQGIRIEKNKKGTHIYITEQKSSRLQWGVLKKKKAINNNDLISVFPKQKKEQLPNGGKQYSAIIAK